MARVSLQDSWSEWQIVLFRIGAPIEMRDCTLPHGTEAWGSLRLALGVNTTLQTEEKKKLCKKGPGHWQRKAPQRVWYFSPCYTLLCAYPTMHLMNERGECMWFKTKHSTALPKDGIKQTKCGLTVAVWSSYERNLLLNILYRILILWK